MTRSRFAIALLVNVAPLITYSLTHWYAGEVWSRNTGNSGVMSLAESSELLSKVSSLSETFGLIQAVDSLSGSVLVDIFLVIFLYNTFFMCRFTLLSREPRLRPVSFRQGTHVNPALCFWLTKDGNFEVCSGDINLILLAGWSLYFRRHIKVFSPFHPAVLLSKFWHPTFSGDKTRHFISIDLFIAFGCLMFTFHWAPTMADFEKLKFVFMLLIIYK